MHYDVWCYVWHATCSLRSPKIRCIPLVMGDSGKLQVQRTIHDLPYYCAAVRLTYLSMHGIKRVVLGVHSWSLACLFGTLLLIMHSDGYIPCFGVPVSSYPLMSNVCMLF
jgi:hypothetical protein